jgi:photosystem II stability/assembly factor-like uncharacterized protein
MIWSRKTTVRLAARLAATALTGLLMMVVAVPCLADSAISGEGLLSAPSQPRSLWQWHRGGNFLDADFPTADEGWFGGDALVKVIKLWDGTRVAYQQAEGITDQRAIVDVDFFDADNGWALTDDGAVMCTSNGGVSWQLFADPMPGMDITRLDMTWPGSGFATALTNDNQMQREAAVLEGVDCGASWHVAQSSGNFVTILGDVRMITPQVGVAVGYNHGWGPDTGTFWWTEDRWHTVTMREVAKPLWKVALTTAEDFYALSGDYMVHVHDGLVDREIALPDGFVAADFFFDSDSTGWLVGSNVVEHLEVARTINGGTTWSRQTLSSPITRLQPYVITGASDGSLWVSGRSIATTGELYPGANGVTLISDDGGDSWSRIESLSSVQPQFLSLAARMGDDAPAMLVGWLGRSKASLKLQAGAHNAPTILGEPEGQPYDLWGGVAMIDGSNAWATSSLDDDSMLLHTTNGGASWIKQTNSQFGRAGPTSAPDTDDIWAMFYGKADDPTTGYWDAFLVTSPNGGNNWYAGAQLYMPSNLFTDDGARGWAVANNGLMRTTDGGATFHADYVAGGVEYAAWIDDNHGWVLNVEYYNNQTQQYSQSIRRTWNAGSTWQETTELAGSGHSVLSFQDSQVGYVDDCPGASSCRLLRTTDGGFNWHVDPDGIVSYGGFKLLEVGSTGQGWAVTYGGAVLYHGSWQRRYQLSPAGGMFLSPDGGRLQVDFAAGSVSGQTQFTVDVLEPATDGERIVAFPYELRLDPDAPLAHPLALTTRVDAGQQQSGVNAQSSNAPEFVIWQGGSWQPLPGQSYDPQTGTVTASSPSAGIIGISQTAERTFMPFALSP